MQNLQGDLTERNAFAVGEGAELELRGRLGAVADPGAGGRGELEVARDEVGVEVGVDDADDPHAVGGRVGEVVLDVTARVDDDRLAGLGVPDEVGRLGEAVQVVLGEVQHRCS